MSVIDKCSPLVEISSCSIILLFLVEAASEAFELFAALLVKFEIANPKSMLGNEGADKGVAGGGYAERRGGVGVVCPCFPLFKGFCKAVAKNWVSCAFSLLEGLFPEDDGLHSCPNPLICIISSFKSN